ncbi:MAG: diacylglycerol kinase family lipid kinase [Sphingobacteriales bacterium]|nr:diacylglycerol kinase family lipid kinase [Sphingobacteriales bacterium]MBP9141115.1 diacylglycerol kinase family lipid kinase [Chitinophagales bacterium]MDA0197719.1 diacylglycerol kinase family lipid kinase [Bacteroidota bacterium]MBK7528676.1 diacylglycerol kinase family lipid kinase [Sphingobacteriales bacterium]MBK8679359.1 diacylglycerol kinase family lipid kinase [Sphingobacteriales bacterium]
MEKVLIIINPIAGARSKVRVPDVVRSTLDKKRFVFETVFTEGPQHAQELATQAVQRGYKYIGGAGGDGTINEVASALVGTNCTLLLIPLGSGNGLAYKLKIPINARKSINYLNQGNTQLIDVGTVNDRYFFSNCGAGFEAVVVQHFNNIKRRGFNEYTRVIANQYFSYEVQTYHIELPNQTITERIFMLNFGNTGQYGYQVGLSPNSQLNDGVLEMAIVKQFPRWRASYLIPLMAMGRAQSSDYVSLHSITQAKVLLPPNAYVQIDGDAYKNPTNELHIGIKPSALNVIVP